MIAPLVIDGALNGSVFVSYVRQHLAPASRSGDILLTDNLNSHKVSGNREAVENVGPRVLYLPLYSPDFNPIEQVFSKLKWNLRSPGAQAVEALWETCGKFLGRFPPRECDNDFKHCGYRST